MSRPEKIVSINTKENKAEAFDRIMRGVNLLCDAVRQTLGPFGRNFIIEKSGGRITNDGITIAREIQARDEIEDLAIRVVRESAIKTNDDAGDGTTTATTLTQAILSECAKYMARGGQFARRSVIALKKQIEKECAEVVEKMREVATPIKTKEQLIEVARVSVEDEELAKLIGTAQWDLGTNGVIVPEENTEPQTTVEKVRGIRIDNGVGTAVVFNDAEKQRLYVKNVPVFLTNHTLQEIPSELESCINSFIQAGQKEIILVAKAYTSEVIRVLVDNANKPGGVKIYPMQAPYVNQREIMKDLEATLGGRYLDDEGAELSSVTPEDFGLASLVIGYRYSAHFVGQQTPATDTRVQMRLEKLKQELRGEPSKFQKKALETRIAQLENGFALLKVGSTSDADRKYKLDKVEDAVNTVRSAFQEGTVPGAGLVFKTISEGMPDDAILKTPLLAPYRQIMENAGETFEVEPWVRNSLKVDRVALENACQVAATLITVGGAVAQEKVKPIDQLLKQNHGGQ